MNTIAERLLKVRGKIKQGDFAATLQVNANTLRSYENGRSLPNSDFLNRVCVQFLVSPEWLIMGTGPMRLGEDPNSKVEKSSKVGDMEPLLAAKQETIVALKDQVEGLKGQVQDLKGQVARLQAENMELREDARRGGVAIHSTAALNFAQSAPLTSQRSD